MYNENSSLPGAIEEKTRDKLYIWISETANGEKDTVEGNNIVYF